MCVTSDDLIPRGRPLLVAAGLFARARDACSGSGNDNNADDDCPSRRVPTSGVRLCRVSGAVMAFKVENVNYQSVDPVIPRSQPTNHPVVSSCHSLVLLSSAGSELWCGRVAHGALLQEEAVVHVMHQDRQPNASRVLHTTALLPAVWQTRAHQLLLQQETQLQDEPEASAWAVCAR